MSEEADYLFALEMQNNWNADDSDDELEVKRSKFKRDKKQIMKRSNPRSNLDEEFINRMDNLVHPQWETLDPTPDVNALFRAFDDKFFQGRLKCVSLEWSKRMYSCAGICYSRRNRLGMAITIRLSEPLLKLRPRKDLVETLLHEMIHAYCSVLGIREGNGGHGPNFKKIMIGINKVAGTNITVYHMFYDEVSVYKTHWWRCIGVCQHRSPFFGYVKRTSNRAPGPNDQWWEAHHASCGGTFMKIKEPEKKSKNKENSSSTNIKSQDNANDMRNYFPTSRDGIKEPVKTNGGGTVVLNPNRKVASTVVRPALPPTHTPDVTRKLPKTAGGNLSNVVSLKDLSTIGEGSYVSSKEPAFSMTGTGYSLISQSSLTSNLETSENSDDRQRIRDAWSKRFSRKPSENQPGQSESSSGDSKRRRISLDSSSPLVANDSNKSTNAWITIDDDIMFQDPPKEIIDLSSSDDESETFKSPNSIPHYRPNPSQTAEERKDAIKQEILDESFGEIDPSDSEIEIIDDNYNDDEDLLSLGAELADTSLIDDIFGEDTLLKEFKLENDVIASGSRRNLQNPMDDIITCPICQAKMKREVLGDHLDGCTGIAVKVQLPKQGNVLKKLAATSRILAPKKGKKLSKKNILRNAGYSEQDIASIASPSSAEEADSDRNSTDQLQRQRGLFSQTRPCPVCCAEVNVDAINEHLDRCLS